MPTLEYLGTGDWDAARRNFERLADVFSLAVQDTDGFGLQIAGINVRFKGGALATWTASDISAAVTIPHGLGTTPTTAGAFSRHPGYAYAIDSRNATNIVVKGFKTNGGAVSTTLSFDWIAIA